MLGMKEGSLKREREDGSFCFLFLAISVAFFIDLVVHQPFL